MQPADSGNGLSPDTGHNRSLRERLHDEAGELAWHELARHFARGVVVTVQDELDIVDAAIAVVKNDLERVQGWLDSGLLTRASDDDARGWVDREPTFRCLVAAPWVMVQEISDESIGKHRLTSAKGVVMNVQKIAAFSDGDQGGNPAGVVIADAMPADALMQQTAADVGYSETVFAAATATGWRVRYFSPESEVPFCGHATIALGAVLAQKCGPGVYPLTLNDASITVEGMIEGKAVKAALESPRTSSRAFEPELLAAVLTLFGYTASNLDPAIPPARAHGGADHLIVALASRDALRAMRYDLNRGRTLMNDAGLVTICLVFAETPRLFHTRNAFASGGVYEDPATGAATAALAGYLRDLDWPHEGVIDIVQGEDMGSRSLLRAEISVEKGSAIRVSGATRPL